MLSLPRIFDDAPVAHLTPPSWCMAEGVVLFDPGGDRSGMVWLCVVIAWRVLGKVQPGGAHPSPGRTRSRWVGWAQQPWLAASLGEEQLRIETHECQVCWTGLTFDQGSGPVLWTYTGRKTLPPSTSLAVMGEISGVNTASLGGYLHSTKTRARWAEGFHELNGHTFDLERDGLRQVVLCPRLTMR